MEEIWQERTIIQIGELGLEKLKKSKIAIIGLGGVGAYAAEMICRSGVENLILSDADTYNPTNKNRQLGALDSTIGKKKTQVMRERLLDINKDAKIEVFDQFVTHENISQIIPLDVDFVVDAIDTLSPKIDLIKYCIQSKIPLVSSMGAGAKYDGTKLKIADLKKSYNCPLAYMLRKRLRKEGIYGGFKVVFSEELPDKSAIIPFEERNKKSRAGTISYLPAMFGCLCAQEAISHILNNT